MTTENLPDNVWSITPSSMASDATVAADHAAATAGVQVTSATTQEQAREAVDVWAKVWPISDGRPPVSPELAWALAHGGGYLGIATVDGHVIGGGLGFLARDADGLHLHSHLAGVLPGSEGQAIGFAIKQHQRAWALEQGLDRIVWTFDPLVARNAFFNVSKLGASLHSFYVDFYGPLGDALNDGDETDRCLVSWEIASPRAIAAAAGRRAAVDIDALRAAGAPVVLDRGPDGGPETGGGEAGTLLCRVPEDIVSLRTEQPATAAAWRHALRATLEYCFGVGYHVSAVARDGWYVLSR